VIVWKVGGVATNSLTVCAYLVRAICALLCAQHSRGFGWIDNSLSYKYGAQFCEPFNSQDITKNIVNFTPVVVDDAQVAEAYVGGVVIAGKQERVVALGSAVIRVAPVLRFAQVQHDRTHDGWASLLMASGIAHQPTASRKPTFQ